MAESVSGNPRRCPGGERKDLLSNKWSQIMGGDTTMTGLKDKYAIVGLGVTQMGRLLRTTMMDGPVKNLRTQKQPKESLMI